MNNQQNANHYTDSDWVLRAPRVSNHNLYLWQYRLTDTHEKSISNTKNSLRLNNEYSNTYIAWWVIILI